ncbi:MAG: hypothetical protein ACKKMR_02650 [Candidatus Nealsonbacteria bacterium]
MRFGSMSKILSQNKRVLFLALGIALFLSLLPLQTTKAVWGCGLDLWCLIGKIITYLVTVPIRLIVFLTMLPIFFMSFAAGVLYIIIALILEHLAEISLSVGVTPSALGPDSLVTVGWEFTSGLVNMFFILVLVFIGLATILRIKDYEAKKALPKLIIIAILVNFTPVIVGFIVDIGNIVTNFFYQGFMGTLGSSAINVSTKIWTEMMVVLARIWLAMPGGTDFFDMGEVIAALVFQLAAFVAYGVIGLIFLAYSSVVYLAVAYIFILRIVWLWILMIFAPIAFLSYIFPSGSKVKLLFPGILNWDNWWEELIRWVIVAIPLSFFIFLSSYMMAKSEPAIFKAPEKFAEIDSGATQEDAQAALLDNDIKYLSGLLEDLIDPVIGLSVLIIGWKLSKDSAPEAARAVIQGVQDLPKTMAKIGLGVATGGLGMAAGGLAGVAAKGLSRVPLKGFKKLTVAPLLKYQARAQKRVMGVSDDFKEMSLENKQLYMGTLGKRGRVAHASYMAKEGELAKTDEKFKNKIIGDAEGTVNKDYAKKHVGEIANALPDMMTEEVIIGLAPKDKKEETKNKIEEARKEMIDMLGDEGIEEEIKIKYKINIEDITDDIRKQFLEKDLKNIAASSIHVGKLKPAKVAEMSASSLKSLAVRRGSRNWTSGHLAKVRDSFDKETTDDFFEGTGGINSIGEEELKKINPRLVRYFDTSPAGKQWGYKGTKGTTPLSTMEKEIRELTESPAPLPEIKRKRGTKKVRTLRKQGKEFISHINKQIKEFREIIRERRKLEKQIEVLSKEELKAVLPVEKGVIRQRIEKREKRIKEINTETSKEIQKDIEDYKLNLTKARRGIDKWKLTKDEKAVESLLEELKGG